MSLRVSIVVPTYRRPELHGRCLGALAVQTMAPNDYEIVVADDAASEATRRQIEGFATKARCEIRYILMTQAHGPAAARNAGWRAAQAPIVAFTDDDSETLRVLRRMSSKCSSLPCSPRSCRSSGVSVAHSNFACGFAERMANAWHQPIPV